MATTRELTAPPGRTGVVVTVYGSYPIVGGKVIVDTRAIRELIRQGFTATGMPPITAAEILAGVMNVNGFTGFYSDIDGTRTPVNGQLTVTAENIESTYALNFTVSELIFKGAPPVATVPAAITGMTATAGGGQVVLAWATPADGGAAITDYAVQYRTSPGGAWAAFSDGVSASTGATVTGLTNGTAYDFRVAAVNAVGQAAWSNVPTATPTGAGGNPVTAVVMGQSELAHLTSSGSLYRQIPQATLPPTTNLTLYLQEVKDGPVFIRQVNSATVAAGQINPAMSALSAFLAYAAPGRQFVWGDGYVPGTGRQALGNDTTDATDDRTWADFANVFTAIAADYGNVGTLIECWYNSDASRIANFKTNFWPLYFGTLGDGTEFALGTMHAPINSQVDHCIWDAKASPGVKGRGILARNATRWEVLTPMPFLSSPVAPATEADNYSYVGATLGEPNRSVLAALPADALAASVNLRVGPSAHICKFGGASSSGHPDVGNPDGQIMFLWPFALSMLRASGMTINEPEIVGIEADPAGAWADILVSLPNGGNLTTVAALEGRAAYAKTSPLHQPATGFEIERGVTRKPLFNANDVGRPAAYKGTATVTDAGSGNPRRGRVRITPEQPFALGDSVSYLRGSAIAQLQEPRDLDLYPWFLIESIPALRDVTATYPFPGVAVKPYQAELNVPVDAGAFAARAIHYDGSTRYDGTPASVGGTNAGMCSMWFRQNGTWAGNQTVFTLRTSSVALSIGAGTSGRATFTLGQDGTGSDSVQTSTGTFVADKWYHILWSWDWTAGRMQVYINGVALDTSAYSFAGASGFDLNATLTKALIGSATNGAGMWIGDVGHLYINLNQSLDFSVSANRAKFAVGGLPVDLGADGSLPTGTAPSYYYDGDGAGWLNQGSAGNVPLIGGPLTVAGTTPGYTP